MKRQVGGILDDFFEGSITGKNKAPTITNSENNINDLQKHKINDPSALIKEIEIQSEKLSKMNQSSIDLLSDEEKNEINNQVQRDFGGLNLKNSPAKSMEVSIDKNDISKINNLNALLSKEITGQEKFVHDLCIGLKRPLVMGQEKGKILNGILLCGQRGSGKHSAISKAIEYLNAVGVLQSPKIHIIDLALYIDKSDETLFVQDVYMAAKDESSVILFDNLERCSNYYLQLLSDILVNSKLQLNKRYGINKNQLVEANNTLLANAISSISFAAKYIICLADKTLGKLSDDIGTNFISTFLDVCETKEFEKDDLLVIIKALMADVNKKAHDNLDFNMRIDDLVYAFISTNYKKDMGIYSLIDYTDRIYTCLSQYKLENVVGELEIDIYIMGDELYARFKDDVRPLFSLVYNFLSSDLLEVKQELNDIVGLDTIKDYLMSLEDDFKVQALRKKQGLKTAIVSKHMIFTGNPGTGKTTIARILARYLKAIGVLNGGQLKEVTRADLVGRYVGHTAPLTHQVIKSALGGVLFIDEAYGLYRGKDDNFGLEAIDSLVKGMEDNRDNLLVVLAGYSKEMQEFLGANSGLKSRFPNIVEFPDYSGEELLKIANIQANSKDYILSEECQQPLLEYFTRMQLRNAKLSGNGRLARNKIEEAILNQSKRLIAKPSDNMKDIILKDFNLDVED